MIRLTRIARVARLARLARLVVALAPPALGACDQAAAPCDGPRSADRTARFALVTSDYATSAIGLLDEHGALLDEAIVDSGSTAPVLGAALSGDVVLPTRLEAEGLVALDRLRGTATTFDLEGRVVRHAGLAPSVEGVSTLKPNPYDHLALDAMRAVVTRFGHAANPDAGPLARGNDLAVLDGAVLTHSVPFDALDREVDGVRYRARPSRLARLGDDAIAVGLARADDTFRVGPGAVAVVPLAALSPSTGDGGAPRALELEGLSNCGEIATAGDGAVFVLCAGGTFVDEDGRRASAGLVRVSGDAEGARAEVILRAADRPEVPVPAGSVVALSPASLVYVALGDEDAPDRLVHFDVTSGAATVAFTADAAFALGRGATTGGRLFVPDASRGVLVFEVVAAAPGLDTPQLALGATHAVSPCRRLPARELVALTR